MSDTDRAFDEVWRCIAESCLLHDNTREQAALDELARLAASPLLSLPLPREAT